MNLYVGADFTPVLTLDPTDPEYFTKVITGVAAIHAQVLRIEFSRARRTPWQSRSFGVVPISWRSRRCR